MGRLSESKLSIVTKWKPVTCAEVSTFQLRTKRLDADRWAGVAKSKEMWMHVPVDNAWTASYRLTVQKGQPVVAEIRVYPAAGFLGGQRLWTGDIPGISPNVPAGGITARLLRRLKVGRDLRTREATLTRLHETGGDVARRANAIGLKRPTPRAKPFGGVGRPAILTQSSYSRLAARSDALTRAGSSTPLRDLAREMELSYARLRSGCQRITWRRRPPIFTVYTSDPDHGATPVRQYSFE
jgi:hypothetical protein